MGRYLLALVLMIFMSIPKSSVQSFGPTNITRRVGEDDVVIMCPTIDNSVPIWSINEIIYTSATLPRGFKAALDNLLIPFITESMDEFTFQCFIPIGTGLNVVSSSIGILSVMIDSSVAVRQLPFGYNMAQISIPKYFDTIPPPVTTMVQYNLTINHRDLKFDKNKIKLAWLYSEVNAETCSRNSVRFKIKGWQCPNSQVEEPEWEKITNNLEYDIEKKNEPWYYTIEAISTAKDIDDNTMCTVMEYSVQVHSSALTEKISTAIGRNICALIPPRINNSTIIAVWPKSLNDSIVGSSDNDHICPLCNTTECHLLRCSGINETEYRVTLNSTEQGDALCVNNAVEEMNNLYFQFYIEESRCYEYSSTSFGLSISSTINRLYLNSYYIRIELPSTPSVHVEGDSICFSSVAPTEFPVQYYNVSIQDMTGENVFSRSPRAPLNCTAAMDIFDNSICAPYIIEVVAVNMNGNSYSASETVGNISEGSNACKCLNTTVNVTASTEVQDISITMIVFCDVTRLPSHNLELHIELYSNNVFQREKVIRDMCGDKKKNRIDFNHLHNEKDYNYSIVSIASKNQCVLQTGHFKTKVVDGPRLIATIVTPIAAVALFVSCFGTLPLVVAIIIICINHLRKKKEYTISTTT